MDKPILPLLVIADDTTGALDTGVQFSKQGFPTLVVPDSQLPLKNGEANNLQVLIVDTGTRNVSPGVAYQRVKEAIELALSQFEIQNFYKKTDSTLRGNIGKEFEALFDVTGGKELFFVPAFPRMGRITQGGYQLIQGKPIHQTNSDQSLSGLVREGYIPEVIQKQSSLSVEVIGRNRGNIFRKHNSTKRNKVVVLDAENDQDLNEIGLLLRRENKTFLTAGCAGFAEYLAQILDLQIVKSRVLTPPSRWLVIGGSLHPLSLEQLDFASQNGISQIILPSTFFFEDSVEDFFQKIWYYFQRDPGFIIRTVESRKDLKEYRELAQKQGWEWEKVPSLISQKLGNLVKELIKRSDKRRTMIVFGGDTTRGILESLGWKRINPGEELLPGVPLSQVVIEEGEELYLITKAGAFGEKETLVRLINIL